VTVAFGQQRPPAFRSCPAKRPPCGCSRVAPVAGSRAHANACGIGPLHTQSRSRHARARPS
jgi:hypothetical protein